MSVASSRSTAAGTRRRDVCWSALPPLPWTATCWRGSWPVRPTSSSRPVTTRVRRTCSRPRSPCPASARTRAGPCTRRSVSCRCCAVTAMPLWRPSTSPRGWWRTRRSEDGSISTEATFISSETNQVLRRLTSLPRRITTGWRGTSTARPRPSTTRATAGCSKVTCQARCVTWPAHTRWSASEGPVMRAMVEQDRAEALIAAGLVDEGVAALRAAAAAYARRRLYQRQGEADLARARYETTPAKARDGGASRGGPIPPESRRPAGWREPRRRSWPRTSELRRVARRRRARRPDREGAGRAPTAGERGSGATHDRSSVALRS